MGCERQKWEGEPWSVKVHKTELRAMGRSWDDGQNFPKMVTGSLGGGEALWCGMCKHRLFLVGQQSPHTAFQ